MEAANTTAHDQVNGAGAVERIDVDPVNAAAARPLYEKRRKIFPRKAQGRFRSLKWVILAVTLGIYYLLPWVRWDRGSNAPDQAVLVDFPGQRFYFFFIEIWPQEFYFVTGLLILASLSLFLVTSIAGRVWCGYTCPQTVWTDLFIMVERMVEGDRNARMRLDAAKWSGPKIVKRAIKHTVWLIIAMGTGGAWVFYFADAPTLTVQLLQFDAPLVSYVFIGLLTFTTYMLAGHAREQVCTYMCPWPRIQGAMLDDQSLLVSYRAWRGEPRGSHKKGDSWVGRGDCVDCNACVAVCPMGIDIRDGEQLECINCALCIDACTSIMDKVGRPRGLIAYDTVAGLRTGKAGVLPNLLRARTIIYAVLIGVVGVIILVGLGSRTDTEISVLRDRNPLFVTLSDGRIRNGYTIKFINKARTNRSFRLSAAGLTAASVSIVGQADAVVNAEPDRLRSLRVYVTAPGDGPAVSDFELRMTEVSTSRSVDRSTTFRRAR